MAGGAFQASPVFSFSGACQNPPMSEIPDIVDFLRELPGFDALDDTLLGKCARNIDIEYYRKGDDILTIGTDNRSLHIVRTGAVELRNEEEEMMARLAEGDCFGFPSLMNNTPTRNHSVALEDTLIYHLGGYVSVLNADLIDQVNYLPGNYGVQYGRSTGGVVDVTTKSDYPEQARISWSTDLLDSGGLIQGRMHQGVCSQQ